MIDEADWSRVARYFAGECSAEEANAIRTWLAANESRSREAERLHELWKLSSIAEPAANTDAAWQRLSARMHVGEALPSIALHQSRKHIPAPRIHLRRAEFNFRRFALVVTPLAIAASAFFVTRRAEVEKFWSTEVREPALEKDREFRTARGQRAVVVLSDGSRVELGAESILRVKPFHDSARVVTLKGQAVFDVVHDAAHPFFVHTRNAIAEDLGTRFSVRGYPDDNRVQVLVTSGKVALRAVGAPSSSGTLLGPSDLGILDSTGRATVRNGVDSASYLAWTRDRFVFQNAPLSDVLPEIARWFDVQITVQDSALLRRRVTLNVPARSLNAVLGAATVPLGLHYAATGRTVIVR